ncbi:MAG: domain containing protein [Marmoricola sp.]|nr:domain containing protein [Marmoricola sp.]
MWRVGLAGPTSATAAGYGPGSVVRQSQRTRLIALGNFDASDASDASKHHQDLVLHLTGAASTTADWQSAFYETACAKAFNSYVRDLDFSPDGSFFVVATTGAYGLHRTGLATARAVPTGTLAPGHVRGAFMLNGWLYMAWSNGTFDRRTFDGTNCGVAGPVDTSSKLTALTDWSFDVSARTGLFYDSGRLYFTGPARPRSTTGTSRRGTRLSEPSASPPAPTSPASTSARSAACSSPTARPPPAAPPATCTTHRQPARSP